MKNIEKDFFDEIEQNYDEYKNDYADVFEKVSKSKAVYKGKPVPFLYMPKFFDKQDIGNFNNLISKMFTIVNKTIEEYVDNPEFRKKFGFDKKLEELIIFDHKYRANVPMGRFDIFYHSKNKFKFCELNADGASAMTEDKALAEIFSDSKILNNLSDRYDISSFELFDTWVKEVENIYNEFGGQKTKPTVAIVDFIDKSSPIEFEEFKAKFNEHGMNAIIVDPRDLNYINNKLVHEGTEIDIIYRRLVTRDMMERYDEIPNFIRACKDENVCLIGPIKSQIIHNKKFFSILYDEEFRMKLTEKDKNFIDNHVPYTELFAYKEFDFDDLIARKDGLILKPYDYYASKGVYSGKDHSPEEWKEILSRCYGREYLIQEYCPLPMTKNLIFENNKAKYNSFGHITGIFVYNEKVYGLYSRAGLNSIISGLHDGFTLPSLYYDEVIKKS